MVSLWWDKFNADEYFLLLRKSDKGIGLSQKFDSTQAQGQSHCSFLSSLYRSVLATSSEPLDN